MMLRFCQRHHREEHATKQHRAASDGIRKSGTRVIVDFGAAPLQHVTKPQHPSAGIGFGVVIRRRMPCRETSKSPHRSVCCSPRDNA
jgi:hypothetical protein